MKHREAKLLLLMATIIYGWCKIILKNKSSIYSAIPFELCLQVDYFARVSVSDHFFKFTDYSGLRSLSRRRKATFCLCICRENLVFSPPPPPPFIPIFPHFSANCIPPLAIATLSRVLPPPFMKKKQMVKLRLFNFAIVLEFSSLGLHHLPVCRRTISDTVLEKQD